METIIDRLIIGNSSGTGYTTATQDLIERIASGQDIVVSEATFLNTDPFVLAVLMFNYPLITERGFQDFATAVKKISVAKYTYYKKSSSFKDSFNKLLGDLFNKFHSSDLRDQKDQIQKVKYAIPLTKFLGELYKIDFINSQNIKYFLEILIKNDTSKVSEDCLKVLISIISDHARNEFKKLHKHNHDVHTDAIMKILAEYEEGFDEANAKKKKNYKDLEIIEAYNKSINKNGTKVTKVFSKKIPTLSSKSEVIKQAKKLLETILAGSLSLSVCIQKAHDISILYADTFENEMFQLCFDYIKRQLVNVDESNLTTTCVTLGNFIGKLYCADVFHNEPVKGTLSLLSKFEEIEYTKKIQNTILNSIHAKAMESNDEILKSYFPDGFVPIQDDGEAESDESNVEAPEEKKQEEEPAPKIKKEEKKSPVTVSSASNGQPSVSVAIPIPFSSIDRFKELLSKLSLTNVDYILREISKISFSGGDETFSDLASLLVQHALKKQSLIKAVVQICHKLPDTVVPHFQISILKKHLKAVILKSVVGCSEDKAIGCSQFVKEMHVVGIYDRFDIILLLEHFTNNFDNDRTALGSLITFTEELKDIINSNKKLSKNMSMKIKRIAENLKAQMRNENYRDQKVAIEEAIKILNGEYKAQLATNSNNASNSHVVHQDSRSEADELEDSELDMPREPQQMILGNLILKYPSRKMSPAHTSNPVNSLPPSPPPPPPIQRPYMSSQASMDNGSISNDTFFNVSTPDRSTPSTCGETSSSSNDDGLFSLQHPPEELYSAVVNNGPPNASEMHDEDDQFYDTCSNNSGNENESSNYKFLEECTRDRIQELRELIFEQVSAKELSEFVATIVLLGTKFQSINTFLKFVNVVEEALDRQGKDAHVNFKRYLELKIPTFYDLMICSQDTPKSEREKNEIEHLIIITGEFYNKSLISDKFFLNVLQKLWNIIINAHHVKIFNLLIVTSAAKIVKSGLTPTCKDYLDTLAKHIHSFEEVRDRQFLSNDIVKTLRLLMIHYQENKKSTPVNSVNAFKTLLIGVNEENFKQTIQSMKSVFPVKRFEMIEIVELYIKAATYSTDHGLFIKFAEKIRNAASSDANLTFKMQLEERLKNQIGKLLENVIREEPSEAHNQKMEATLLKWTLMVSDLYLCNVVSIDLLAAIFQALFEREANHQKIVNVISILMKKVASKMDQENEKVLDNFFNYFSLVTLKEDSYRTKIYKELMHLRSVKWCNEKKDALLMEELLAQLEMKNMIEITKSVSKMIVENESNLKEFVILLWKFVIENPEPDDIMKHAKLAQGLSYIVDEFKPALMQFMKQRNSTFCAIPLQQFLPPISKKLSSTIHFMCYLYLIDVAAESDLEMWMRPNLVQHLTLMQNVDFSIKLAPKINDSTNVNLKAFLTFVELSVKEQLSGIFNDVKNTLKNATN